jgi:hypothetical protein
MMQEHMDLLFTVIWSFALANILGAALCLTLCRPLARLTAVRFDYLAPAILIIMMFGAYQSTKHLGDLWVMLLLGLLGWGMKRLGWPRPPFLIAFVLSNPTERYLWISVNRYGMEWLARPGVLVILALLILSLAYWVASRWRKAREARTAAGQEVAAPPARWRLTPGAWFCLGLLLVLLAAAWEATHFPFFAALLPMVVAVPAVVMGGWQLLVELRGGERKETLDLRTSEAAASRAGTLRALLLFGVLLAYYALTVAVGFRLATLVFLVGFLRYLPKAGWVRTTVYTAAVFAVVEVFSRLLELQFPEGLWQLTP